MFTRNLQKTFNIILLLRTSQLIFFFSFRIRERTKKSKSWWRSSIWADNSWRRNSTNLTKRKKRRTWRHHRLNGEARKLIQRSKLEWSCSKSAKRFGPKFRQRSRAWRPTFTSRTFTTSSCQCQTGSEVKLFQTILFGKRHNH